MKNGVESVKKKKSKIETSRLCLCYVSFAVILGAVLFICCCCFDLVGKSEENGIYIIKAMLITMNIF